MLILPLQAPETHSSPVTKRRCEMSPLHHFYLMLPTASAPGVSTPSFIDYSITEQLCFRTMEAKALKRKGQIVWDSSKIHLAQYPVSNTGCQMTTTAAIKHSIFQTAATSGWGTLGARTNTFILGGGAGVCPRLSSCFLACTDPLQLGIVDVTHLQLHHLLCEKTFWTTTYWLPFEACQRMKNNHALSPLAMSTFHTIQDPGDARDGSPQLTFVHLVTYTVDSYTGTTAQLWLFSLFSSACLLQHYKTPPVTSPQYN